MLKHILTNFNKINFAQFLKYNKETKVIQGGNSQSFIGKFVRFFLILRCFYGVVIHRKYVIYDFYSS